MREFSHDDKIGKIMALFPGSMKVFLEYGVDFCSMGNCQLAEVASTLGLNYVELTGKLNRAYRCRKGIFSDMRAWKKDELEVLTEYFRQTPFLSGITKEGNRECL
ncbi:MAG: DUF542 domain-containing protein [Halanaerobium sp.]|nr:DUF542 domain-containing protein [Halanaerobium sp.]